MVQWTVYSLHTPVRMYLTQFDVLKLTRWQQPNRVFVNRCSIPSLPLLKTTLLLEERPRRAPLSQNLRRMSVSTHRLLLYGRGSVPDF